MCLELSFEELIALGTLGDVKNQTRYYNPFLISFPTQGDIGLSVIHGALLENHITTPNLFDV